MYVHSALNKQGTGNGWPNEFLCCCFFSCLLVFSYSFFFNSVFCFCFCFEGTEKGSLSSVRYRFIVLYNNQYKIPMSPSQIMFPFFANKLDIQHNKYNNIYIYRDNTYFLSQTHFLQSLYGCLQSHFNPCYLKQAKPKTSINYKASHDKHVKLSDIDR